MYITIYYNVTIKVGTWNLRNASYLYKNNTVGSFDLKKIFKIISNALFNWKLCLITKIFLMWNH